MEIPVIHLAAVSGDRSQTDVIDDNDRAVAEQLLKAFTTIGFATLLDHGVVTESVFPASQSFFALPLETKLKYKFQGYKSNRGYNPIGLETHDKSGVPDMKETFDIGPENQDRDEFVNRWPDELVDETFREPLMAYFASMDALHLRILKLLGIALKLEDPNYLVDRCNQQHENLRLLHYPSIAITDDVEASSGDQTKLIHHREPIIRGNLHTDFGTITLLCQDSVGGLRVQRLDGSWTMVPPVTNGIVVNVGDMLQRWTNDLLRATPHQVIEVLPSDHDQSNDAAISSKTGRVIPDRFSIAFFCNANKDTTIDCLPEFVSPARPARYATINAHDYLLMRLAQTISIGATSL
jgi:isopenicillin N synthase-like dioxygenase